jgi:hypothetical protein
LFVSQKSSSIQYCVDSHFYIFILTYPFPSKPDDFWSIVTKAKILFPPLFIVSGVEIRDAWHQTWNNLLFSKVSIEMPRPWHCKTFIGVVRCETWKKNKRTNRFSTFPLMVSSTCQPSMTVKDVHAVAPSHNLSMSATKIKYTD